MSLKFSFLLCSYFLMNSMELYSHSLNDDLSSDQTVLDISQKREAISNILLDLPEHLIEDIIRDNLTSKDVSHLDAAMTNRQFQKKWRNFLKHIHGPLLPNLEITSNKLEAIVKWSQKRSMTLLADQIDCFEGSIDLREINAIANHLKVLTFSQLSRPYFFDTPFFSHLKKLRIYGQKINHNDLKMISHLNIEELDLECCKDCYGLMSLLQNSHNLKVLKLNWTHINGDDLKAIAQLNLEELEIGTNPYIFSGSFVFLQNLVKLKKLNAEKTKMKANGLAALSSLPELEELNLNCCNQISSGSFSVLANCKKLKKLDVTYTHITVQEINIIREALPGIEIEM